MSAPVQVTSNCMGAVVCALYAGAELLEVTLDASKTVMFQISVEEEDWKFILKDYNAGTQAITDAKQLIETFSKLARLIKRVRTGGKNWVSHDWEWVKNG